MEMDLKRAFLRGVFGCKTSLVTDACSCTLFGTKSFSALLLMRFRGAS